MSDPGLQWKNFTHLQIPRIPFMLTLTPALAALREMPTFLAVLGASSSSSTIVGLGGSVEREVRRRGGA